MAQRIVAHLHLTLSDGTEAVQGQKVEVSSEDAERLGERAFVPEGFDSFDAYSAHLQDVYRGGRGDITAAQRLGEARSGGITDLSSVPAGTGEQTAAYAEWLRDSSPTVDETVAAANDDPERARALLEAENLATGQEPRAGVVKGLEKIIDGGE